MIVTLKTVRPKRRKCDHCWWVAVAFAAACLLNFLSGCGEYAGHCRHPNNDYNCAVMDWNSA